MTRAAKPLVEVERGQCKACLATVLWAKREEGPCHRPLALNAAPDPEGWVFLTKEGFAVVADKGTLEVLYPGQPRYLPHAFTCRPVPAPVKGGAA